MLGLEYGWLSSRVGRRIFGLFLLSAFVPIVLTIALAFYEVTSTITAQTESQLRDASKSYGMGVLQRLRLAESRLEGVEFILNRVSPDSEAIGAPLRDQFDSLAVVDKFGQLVPVFGTRRDWSNLLDRSLLTGTSNVRIQHDAGTVPSGRATVAMNYRFSNNTNGYSHLVAEINPDYVWGSEDFLPNLTEFCVLDANRRQVQCSQPVSENALASLVDNLGDGHSGVMFLEEGDERYVVGYRELFLEIQFDYPALTVVVFQDRAESLATLSTFKRYFAAAAGISLLAVFFLSFGQIRKSLVPLESLTAGTKRIAAQDFSAEVEIMRDDEFGDLAVAFNTMAERLGRQFHALGTLSEIDRLIIASPDVDQLAKTLLKRIPELLPCEVAAVLINDWGTANRAVIHICDFANDGASSTLEVALSASDCESLASRTNALEFDLGNELPEYLKALEDSHLRTLHVTPVVHRDKLSGLLILGYRGAVGPDASDETQARDLVDRLTVALAASEREHALHHQANYDFLTGLPNRQLLMEIVNREAAFAKRKNSLLALLFIDLDHFKVINDSMGHAAGDQLLTEAARRLRACVRDTDFVARLGGDEFNIVLPQLNAPHEAAKVADTVIRSLSQPFMVHGQEQFVSASIGIAVFPFDGTTHDELMRKADTAMYRAKKEGRGRHLYFKSEMNSQAIERAELNRDLHRALQRGELQLHFQPQLDTDSNTVIGAEALLRWKHPERGFVPPAVFVPLAEESGLIDEIGAWVLRASCRNFRQWKEQGVRLERISVNVSCRQFLQRNFVDLISSTLAETGVAADSLELEVTESLFMENFDYTLDTIEELNARGVRLAIDDFGTGYSSLSYLSHLPAETLKIDRAFIVDVADNRNAAELVSSIIDMAHRLDKQVVIEGVETEAQMDFVKRSACHLVQGYGFCHPLPAGEFEAFVRRQNGSAEPIKPPLLAVALAT